VADGGAVTEPTLVRGTKGLGLFGEATRANLAAGAAGHVLARGAAMSRLFLEGPPFAYEQQWVGLETTVWGLGSALYDAHSNQMVMSSILRSHAPFTSDPRRVVYTPSIPRTCCMVGLSVIPGAQHL
jgi:hypothetical protein